MMSHQSPDGLVLTGRNGLDTMTYSYLDTNRLLRQPLGTEEGSPQNYDDGCHRKRIADVFTLEEALTVGEEIGIFWDEVAFTPEDFLKGLHVELEHGTALSPLVNITDDDPFMTGKIAWAHLLESPRYYDLLEEVEAQFSETTDIEQTEVTEIVLQGCRYRPLEGF